MSDARSWIDRLSDLDGGQVVSRHYNVLVDPMVCQRLHAIFDELLVLREAVMVPAKGAPSTLPSPPPDGCEP